MNPYIKLLGFTDIMSDSEEKTPTVSPDQGATGETTSSGNKEAGTQTGLSEEEEEAHYKEEYTNTVIKLLKNVSMQDPELGRDILMESLLEHFATELRSKRSEEPDFVDETKEEFETYLALLKEVKAHGGHNMELITIQYILKHKGEYYWSALEHKVEAYYQNLCISHSHQEK